MGNPRFTARKAERRRQWIPPKIWRFFYARMPGGTPSRAAANANLSRAHRIQYHTGIELRQHQLSVTAMTYCQFLRHLFENGRVSVPTVAPLLDEELADGDRVIAEYERHDRSHVAGTAPELDVEAARWAAVRFFRACQFAVYRDIDAETIQQELGRPYVGATAPNALYSVDLLFRFLPELAKFGEPAAERDPLLDTLNRWAHDWPLSSVGMKGVEDVSIEGFSTSPALMQMYVDRIIAAEDHTRLSSPVVRDHVRAALGRFPELGPKTAAALAAYEKRNTSA